MMQTYTQATTETLDYRADYTRFLVPGESIIAAEAFASPDTISIPQVTFTDRVATVRLAGGDGNKTKYAVTLLVTTSMGRKKSFQFVVLSLTDPALSVDLPRITVSGGIVYATENDYASG